MRYLPGMEIKDVLRNNLRYAVWLSGGYAKLAEKSEKGSAKYFEQVATGFQGKRDKNPRSLGPEVASSVARAIGKEGNWMHQEHPDLWKSVGDDAPVSFETPTAHPSALSSGAPVANPRIEQILQMVSRADDDQLDKVIATMRLFIPDSPPQQKQSNGGRQR